MSRVRKRGASRLFIAFIVAGVAAGLVAVPSASAAPTGPCASSFNRDINSYVLFAETDLIFKGANASGGGIINGGNVGVNQDNGSSSSELSFTGVTELQQSSQQVVADKIAVEQDATRLYDFYSNATGGSADLNQVIQGCQATSLASFGGLPIISDLTQYDAFTHSSGPYTPKVPNFVVGVADYEVPADTTDSLAPGQAYKKLRVNDKGVLNLSAGTYIFDEISIGKESVINTVNGTTVLVGTSITLQDDSKVQGSSSARFIIRGDGADVTIFSHDATVQGQFFSLGHVDLGGGTQFLGRVWADKISGDPGNTITYDCGPAPDEDANCKKKPPPCEPGPGEDENCNPVTPPCVPGPGQDANCNPIVTPSCVPKAGEDANCKPITPSATDSATLRGPKGCTTSYNVRVSGSNISKVVYSIDGKRVKTVRKSPFTYKLKTTKYKVGAHRLTAKTYFKSGKTKTQRLTFQRCGKSAVNPKFTG